MSSKTALLAGSAVLAALLATAYTKAQDVAPGKERVRAWIEDLGSASLDTREEAWRKLKGLGSDAREALLAAKDHADINVRFGTRRLLEALGETDPFAQLRRRDGAPAAPGLDAPDGQPRAPLPDARGDDVFEELRRFHQEMDRWQIDLDRWMEELLGSGGGHAPFDPSALAPGASASSSTSIQIAPDGSVKVKIKRADGADANETTYEADSLAAFRAQYPEVAQELGLDGSGPWSFQWRHPGANDAWQRTPAAPRGFFRRPAPAPDVADEGPRLGVHIRALTAAEPLELGERVIERGLVVVEVVPGSLAARLGVRSGDVIVKVNGTEIATPEDVRQCLLAQRDGSATSVTVLRGGHERTLRDSQQG